MTEEQAEDILGLFSYSARSPPKTQSGVDELDIDMTGS